MEDERFFTNRELFDRFTKQIDGLSKELTETQRVVKAYNGLREKVDAVCSVVNTMQAENEGKNKLLSRISWAVGIVGALVNIAGGILAIASKIQ